MPTSTNPREVFKAELGLRIKDAIRLACDHKSALQIYRLIDVLPADQWESTIEHIAANLPPDVVGRFAIAEHAFYEQCEHCEHERRFHDAEDRRCGVCGAFCIYHPAYTLKHE